MGSPVINGKSVVLPNQETHQLLELAVTPGAQSPSQVVDMDDDGRLSVGDLYRDEKGNWQAFAGADGPSKQLTPEEAMALVNSAYHLCTIDDWSEASQAQYAQAVKGAINAYYDAGESPPDFLLEAAVDLELDLDLLRDAKEADPVTPAALPEGATDAQRMTTGAVNLLLNGIDLGIPADAPNAAERAALVRDYFLYQLGELGLLEGVTLPPGVTVPTSLPSNLDDAAIQQLTDDAMKVGLAIEGLARESTLPIADSLGFASVDEANARKFAFKFGFSVATGDLTPLFSP